MNHPTGIRRGGVWGSFDMQRHRGMMNVLCADGLVESVTILKHPKNLKVPSGDLEKILVNSQCVGRKWDRRGEPSPQRVGQRDPARDQRVEALPPPAFVALLAVGEDEHLGRLADLLERRRLAEPVPDPEPLRVRITVQPPERHHID